MGESARAEVDIPSACEKCGERCELDRNDERPRMRCVACEHVVDAPMVAAMPGQWTLVDPSGVVSHFASWHEVVSALPWSGVAPKAEPVGAPRSTRPSSAAALLGGVTPAPVPAMVEHSPATTTPAEAEAGALDAPVPAPVASGASAPPRLALVPADDPPPLPREARLPRIVDEPIPELADEDVQPAPSSRDLSAVTAALQTAALEDGGRRHKRVTGLSVPPPLPPGASVRPAPHPPHPSPPPPAPKAGELRTLPPPRLDAPPPPTIGVDSEPAFRVSDSELEIAPNVSSPSADKMRASRASSSAKVAVTAKAQSPVPPSTRTAAANPAKTAEKEASSSSPPAAAKSTAARTSTPPSDADATGRGWLVPVGAVAIVAAIIAYVMHGSAPANDGMPAANVGKDVPTATAPQVAPTVAPSSAATATSTAATSATPAASGAGPAASTSAAITSGADNKAVVGDSQLTLPEVLQRAAAARKSGDAAHAKALLERALELSPGNAEAHGSMADLARSQGDNAAAKASYQKALATSPNYLPAVIGLADTEWDLGDRDAAQRAYRDLVASGRPMPSHVKERAAQSMSAPPVTTAPAATTAPPAPTTTSETPPATTAPAPAPAATDTPPAN